MLNVRTFTHRATGKRKVVVVVVFISQMLFSNKLTLFYILEVIFKEPINGKSKKKKEKGSREEKGLLPVLLCAPDLSATDSTMMLFRLISLGFGC